MIHNYDQFEMFSKTHNYCIHLRINDMIKHKYKLLSKNHNHCIYLRINGIIIIFSEIDFITPVSRKQLRKFFVCDDVLSSRIIPTKN